MKSEKDLIAERYERRKSSNADNNLFGYYAVEERQSNYEKIIGSHFRDVTKLKVLEIGAGSGSNINFFKKMGVAPANIHANELLENRYKLLRQNHPDIVIHEGDACEINISDAQRFDLVFQSTVFTSILDFEFKKKVADKMWSLLKPGGIILWYDFIYNNPSNPDVKGISKDEIKKLFPLSKEMSFTKVTLAPPIGRRVGKLYPFFNLFPFLRTHLIGVILK